MNKSLDEKMLLSFHRFTCEHSKFRKAACFVSSCAAYVFFAVYFVTGIYLWNSRSKLIILYVTVPLANLVISYTIRALVKRKRPYITLNLQTEEKKSYSFPSNHTTSSAIIAFACMSVNIHLGIAVFALAVVTSLSRLFLAVHYPSDVGFGFIQSSVVAIIGFSIVPAFFL